MPRPPKSVRVSLDSIFPLLLYYYAASKDRKTQGEYSTDWTWETFCESLDKQNDYITMTPNQLHHLIYNYKTATHDKRIPTKAVKNIAKQYLPVMKRLKKELPNLFKEDLDNDIVMVDLQYE